MFVVGYHFYNTKIIDSVHAEYYSTSDCIDLRRYIHYIIDLPLTALYESIKGIKLHTEIFIEYVIVHQAL